ncbi:LacI family DNA-binding transcriptional regulator [Poseidonocella sedimentorum]|uniref:Transcriptional regulator, LacI family n=1 Tax=Poseidonocella sedimentorum TaxID=871652 RepID=A0A1I6DLU3_9RHOB|nr:LacI family DNA-binding transcriptional regulator [Poseidonocella sedimentorum]SFR06352.1 transcriptional regulator, LacI family [Poseidonocella sedimentorum]
MTDKVGTIRDVARMTGLSTATVSRVMNGNPKVNPEMRAEVLRVAKQLNYVPNPAARALSTRRSKTVATIIPTIEHSVFAKFITAIEQTLAARGYNLVLAISNAELTREMAAAEQLVAMGAEAFILTGATHSGELLDMLERRSIPVVFTSIFDGASAVPTIGYDNTALATAAIEYLHGNGHRTIAVAHGPTAESDRTAARCRGVLLASSDEIETPLVEVALSVEGGREAARRILEMSPRPSAILCLSDVLALGVMFQLQSMGLTIPDDISIMGFDNLDWSKDSHPSLTTIDLPATRMGDVAARQVVDRLETSAPMTSTRLPARIVERESVRRVT